jgi:hypothetical protein
VIEGGRLRMAMAQYVLDADAAQESIRRLLNYDIEKIVCYHGGVYEDAVGESLRALV